MGVPYASASSGTAAREEINKILRRFGCGSVGFMDDYERAEVLLAFKHRGRAIQLHASAKGWAQMFLKEQPFNHRRRSGRAEYEASALRQGHIAVNSILRDWVKGQVTAVECGIMSFEAVFLSHMLIPDGRTVLAYAEETGVLPKPADVPRIAAPR